MIGTYNDEREGDHLDQALLDDMLSDDDADDDGDALIPVVDVSGNITVDSAFAGEMISQHANTMVIRLLGIYQNADARRCCCDCEAHSMAFHCGILP